jgi:hypothetical protein
MSAFDIACLLPTALFLTGVPIAMLAVRPKGARVAPRASIASPRRSRSTG